MDWFQYDRYLYHERVNTSSVFLFSQNEPWYIQYGWALFKTLSHMLCIGYGRFIPMLLSEAIITIFSMVTGATFYALFIAHSMAYIIQNDSSKTTYQEKVKKSLFFVHLFFNCNYLICFFKPGKATSFSNNLYTNEGNISASSNEFWQHKR